MGRKILNSHSEQPARASSQPAGGGANSVARRTNSTAKRLRSSKFLIALTVFNISTCFIISAYRVRWSPRALWRATATTASAEEEGFLSGAFALVRLVVSRWIFRTRFSVNLAPRSLAPALFSSPRNEAPGLISTDASPPRPTLSQHPKRGRNISVAHPLVGCNGKAMARALLERRIWLPDNEIGNAFEMPTQGE